MNTTLEWTDEDAQRVADIAARVPGYSGDLHYKWWRILLHQVAPESLLMLGCYHGRDIAFLLDILHQYHPEHRMRIVGVDKFSNDDCLDWAPQQKGKTWQEAGFGEPPSFEAATRNISAMPGSEMVELVQSRDEDYLARCSETFRVSYLDTDHTGPTVYRQLKQCRRVLSPNGILCGDDYANAGTWGVIDAVRNSFHLHQVFEGYVWNSPVAQLKTDALIDYYANGGKPR